MYSKTLALLLIFVAACSGGSEVDERSESARVLDVLDGDSIVVALNRERVEVRLFGIDAPERGQAYSTQARDGLAAIVAREDVSLVPVDKDRFGRVVANVIRIDDRLDVNREMVRRGHAWVYRQYNDDKDWLALEATARDSRSGLWANADPVPPWQWRRENPRDR